MGIILPEDAVQYVSPQADLPALGSEIALGSEFRVQRPGLRRLAAVAGTGHMPGVLRN